MAAVSPVGRAAGLEPLEQDTDDRAARELYELHSTKVFAYCLSRLGRREDAEDAVQTTFLHAVRGLRRGVVPSVELAWLLGIARNVCLSRFESAGRRGRLELVCDPVDLERNAAPQGRGDELIGLEQALTRLPEQQRQAVLLRDWRGLSYEEVATHLGVTLANAETLIFRGRRTLAELLEEKPSTVRRKLGALGNLGSVGSAVKTALGGAAAASKIAAAVAVVAVSGAGVAAGSGVLDSADETPQPTRSKPAAARTPAPTAHANAPATPTKASIAAAPQPRGVAKPTADAQASGTPSTAPVSTPAPAPSSGSPAPSEPAPATGEPSAPARTPIPAVKVPAVKDAVSEPTGTVQSTVDDVVSGLPELPVTVPALPEVVGSLPVPALPPVAPVVEDVVETVDTVVAAVPPVTVTTPVTEPVTVDLPKLLP